MARETRKENRREERKQAPLAQIRLHRENVHARGIRKKKT
jgi:hypothetical protein